MMNPRVLLWLQTLGISPEAIARKSGEDIPLVEVDGHKSMWTLLYMEWIQHKWHEWARSLGYKDYRVALADAHSDEEFDQWLEEICGKPQ